MLTKADVQALAEGRHGDPFAVLGMHQTDDGLFVRTILPDADRVQVIEAQGGHAGRVLATLEAVDPSGVFDGPVPRRKNAFAYLLRVSWGSTTVDIEDPYRFPPVLGELDVWLQDATTSGLGPFMSLARGIQADRAAVNAGFTLRWSTGPVEGHVTRVKLLKRQGYGRASTALLRRRVVGAA